MFCRCRQSRAVVANGHLVLMFFYYPFYSCRQSRAVVANGHLVFGLSVKSVVPLVPPGGRGCIIEEGEEDGDAR